MSMVKELLDTDADKRDEIDFLLWVLKQHDLKDSLLDVDLQGQYITTTNKEVPRMYRRMYTPRIQKGRWER